MLDELREQASSTSFVDDELPPNPRTHYRERRFLGMTAFQRFFIALMLLFIICILGSFFLVVAQKVVPGILY
jgi:hypothetical protein